MRITIFAIICLWVAPVFADQLIAREHRDGHYEDRRPEYSRVPHHQETDKDSTEKILEVLLNQGIAGVGLIFLSWFIWKQGTIAREDRRELEGRLISLIEKTNTTLTEQKDHLEGIERELEHIRK
tara:strand:+ start:725 stop:1099 length:375 start_codon:yes stop_codon:yes gene_type:complete